MSQLIELQIIPAQIELRRKEAKIEYVNADVKVQQNTKKGNFEIDIKQAKVNVDTYKSRSSIGPSFQSVEDSIRSYAQKGNSAAQSSTATYASRGQQQMKAMKGQELITSFARQDTFKNVKMNIGIDFIPKVAPEITVDTGDISIRLEMDQLEFDWKMQEQKLQFTPGEISVEMVQRPDVIVRYVGGPNYVPKASDPNYDG